MKSTLRNLMAISPAAGWTYVALRSPVVAQSGFVRGDCLGNVLGGAALRHEKDRTGVDINILVRDGSGGRILANEDVFAPFYGQHSCAYRL